MAEHWLHQQCRLARRTHNITPHALRNQMLPSPSTETAEARSEFVQAVREYIQDRYVDPANPTPFEIALSDAIDNVERNFNA